VREEEGESERERDDEQKSSKSELYVKARKRGRLLKERTPFEREDAAWNPIFSTSSIGKSPDLLF